MGYSKVSRETELYICKLIVDIQVPGLDLRVFPVETLPETRLIDNDPSPEEATNTMPMAIFQTNEEIYARFMCIRNAVDDQRRLVLTVYDN